MNIERVLVIVILVIVILILLSYAVPYGGLR